MQQYTADLKFFNIIKKLNSVKLNDNLSSDKIRTSFKQRKKYENEKDIKDN